MSNKKKKHQHKAKDYPRNFKDWSTRVLSGDEYVKLMSGCKTKKTFWSKRMGENEAAWQSESKNLQISCYRCLYCHGWHLTSQVKR